MKLSHPQSAQIIEVAAASADAYLSQGWVPVKKRAVTSRGAVKPAGAGSSKEIKEKANG